MKNNDIIRRIRYIFNFSDSQMIKIFSLGNYKVTRSEISNWLKKDDDPDYQKLYDKQLAFFLNGLINDNRGKKEGVQVVAEEKLNNNIVFRKLKIALNLKDQDILKILELVGMHISKHELSAFFRNPDKPQYRICNAQILRNFLHGMQIKYRADTK